MRIATFVTCLLATLLVFDASAGVVAHWRFENDFTDSIGGHLGYEFGSPAPTVFVADVGGSPIPQTQETNTRLLELEKDNSQFVFVADHLDFAFGADAFRG